MRVTGYTPPSDVVIDGGGGFSTGIFVTSDNDVAFRNLRVTNSGDAIFAFGTADISVRDVELVGNRFDGLDVDSGGDITVERSIISNNGPFGGSIGLELSDVGNVSITNSEIRNNSSGDGINLLRVGNVLIKNTQGTGNHFDGLEVRNAGDISVSNAVFSNHVLDRGVEIVNAGNIDFQNVDASNNAGMGILLATVGDVSLTNVTANHNGNDGVLITRAGDVEVDHLEAIDNVFEGLDIDFADDVSTSHVTATGNGDNGIELFGIQSWTDRQGAYLSNGNHGALAGDIAGDVALTGTRSENNNTNGNGTGAGVRFFDGSDVDSLAIGGSLAVVNGGFDNNRSGIFSSHTISGDVTIENISASHNELHGLRFADFRFPSDTSIGGNLIIVNAQLNRNEGQGLLVQHAVGGDVTLRNVTANENGFGNPFLAPGNGILILGASNVSIIGGQFNGNEDDGIRIHNALSVTLLGVVAENNGDNDLEVLSSGVPTIIGGTIGNILILP